jgi:two-component system nitrogen regulation sensor histidine kinase GlnL
VAAGAAGAPGPRGAARAGAANKELIRNLAHEIKNPLGGIRGAAQLLEMDLVSRELWNTPRSSSTRPTACKAWWTACWPAPPPAQVGDVNIHEVCERVRSLVLVEHPQGLTVRRDYDISIPSSAATAPS